MARSARFFCGAATQNTQIQCILTPKAQPTMQPMMQPILSHKHVQLFTRHFSLYQYMRTHYRASRKCAHKNASKGHFAFSVFGDAAALRALCAGAQRVHNAPLPHSVLIQSRALAW